jgi:cytochrome c-type biogenesis protein CcsB
MFYINLFLPAMRQIAKVLFSSVFMAVVMALFAISIAIATFIENDFGSASARALVYNAHWFELLLLLGSINLIGNIFIRKLYTRPKLTLLIFHLAFVIILIGAVVTRYTGYEGTLFIREGQSSGSVLTGKTHIQLKIGEAASVGIYDFPVFYTPFGRIKFNQVIRYKDQEFKLTCKSFISNAVPDIQPVDHGKPLAEIIFADSSGRRSLIIASGETKSIGTLKFAFNVPANDSQTIVLTAKGDSIVFRASFPVSLASMSDQSYAVLEKQQQHALNPMQLYTFDDNMIVLNRFVANGKLVPKALPENEMQASDALIMEMTSDSGSEEFILWGKPGYNGISENFVFHNINFLINYGSIYKELPFKLKLIDFKIDRYPGSQSPSSFESLVTLLDPQRNFETTQRIYMNNILKYRGYRFYQSSYDPDEHGTILSVNHDWAGTLFTYMGYLLAGLGMFLSLFNTNSRFMALSSEIKRLNKCKKGMMLILLLLLFNGPSFSQDNLSGNKIIPINPKHAGNFGKLLVQDNSGRIEPVNTLSSEVLRKLYRKSIYKGLNADQVLLGMFVSPALWQNEPIIRATHPQILEIMGSNDKYFSFASFFRNDQYVLQAYIEDAYRKKPALRSKFDNEIIKLDERINISYLVFSGDFLRFFPVPEDSNHTWYNHQGILGKVKNEDSLFVENVLYLYVQDVQESLRTGNWKIPDDIVNAISQYQIRFGDNIIPSPKKVTLEVFMNKSDIFSRISRYYGLIGIALLMLQFAGLFYAKLKLKVPVIIFIILIVSLFALHTAGLGLRWYVSGHAPWSNGYEALTYVAWATVLAGLLFAARSSIALSVTALLACMILFLAHLSWMDPQVTNLVPVLKSYWLVIHVATITASYGFFALSALLAFIDLLLMILQNRKNRNYIQSTIQELSIIVEMSLIIGLYLLTIGVFLGAVWANESWGRYWGWDPKETWALVTVLVYAFILHMRMIPGLKGLYPFNLASLLGIGSVMMTYFGVNYYLSGLHSYAKGDPVPVPTFVYYTLTVIAVAAVLAYMNSRRLKSEGN